MIGAHYRNGIGKVSASAILTPEYSDRPIDQLTDSIGTDTMIAYICSVRIPPD